ncbi:MAG: formylmethanofuran dehydrogenase [Gammaproteobacteria bacterium]|nr:formylmethanofuran dehydrogenase [Gammaproteobacteria bacterium]
MSSTINTRHEDVTCTYCGLLCDDLVVRTDGATVTPIRNACAKATAAYADSSARVTAFIAGQPAAIEHAITSAVNLLRKARQPLVAGLGADLAGLRAAFALAEHCGAVVDHLHGGALRQNLKVLQSRGWQTTTLSELRNRADLVVLVGVDVNVNYQNLIPRFLSPTAALQPERRRERRLIYLGPNQGAPSACGELPLDTLRCDTDALPTLLRALQSALAGGTVSGAPKRRKLLVELAAKIKAAAYPVFVWAAGQLDPAHADLTISAVCDIVASLNRTQRAAGLNLGGDDGGQTAVSAATWLTGFPLSVSYAGNTLDYAPERWSADALLRDRAVDLCVWISAFSPRLPPVAANAIPTIVLGPPGMTPAKNAVYIPVGTPGIDHAGQLIRTDAVVSLPLRQLRHSNLLTVADVLGRTLNALRT